MKNVLILVFLPILVYGQPLNETQNDLVLLDFDMEIVVRMELENERYNSEFEEQQIIMITKLKIPVSREIGQRHISGSNHIPKHLNTLSLTQHHSEQSLSFAPQQRLNSLLALNDPEFPQENTFLETLSPVRNAASKLADTNGIPEGFGPRILF